MQKPTLEFVLNNNLNKFNKQTIHSMVYKEKKDKTFLQIQFLPMASNYQFWIMYYKHVLVSFVIKGASQLATLKH